MLNYAWYFGRASLRNFDAFNTPSFDLGIFDQGVWLLSRFKTPFVTILGLNLFGDHASYIMLAFVPLYWLWPSAKVLLLAQTLALAVRGGAGLPHRPQGARQPWLAVFPAVGYLLTPAVGWLNMENFHPDSFEVPLLLFAIYFMIRGRWRWFLVMVVLLLSIKEDVPLLVVPLGLYVALRYDRRVGFLTAGLAASWFVVTLFILGPLLSGTGAGHLDAWRIPFGGVAGLVSTTVERPWEVGGDLLTADKQEYLFQLLTPVLFLPLLTPLTLVALPSVLFNLVSTFPYQYNLHYHYTSLIVPLFSAAAVLALPRFKVASTRRAMAVLLLPAALMSAYMWGPIEKSREPGSFAAPYYSQAEAAREAIALIPPDAVVSARFSYSPHLGHREQVYDFPNPFNANYYGDDSQKGQRLPEADRVEYVLEIPTQLDGPSATVYPQLADEGFRPIFEKDGVVLLKRGEARRTRAAGKLLGWSRRSDRRGPCGPEVCADAFRGGKKGILRGCRLGDESETPGLYRPANQTPPKVGVPAVSGSLAPR